MSVSLSPSQDSGWSLFDSHITGDKFCCDNCFTRLYKEHDGLVEKLFTAGTEYQQTYSVSDSRTSHCGVCGSDGSCLIDRPLPTETAIEYGENLYCRLNEIEGVSVKKKELLDTIRDLKSEPENQGGGNWIFHEATRRTVDVDLEVLAAND